MPGKSISFWYKWENSTANPEVLIGQTGGMRSHITDNGSLINIGNAGEENYRNINFTIGKWQFLTFYLNTTTHHIKIWINGTDYGEQADWNPTSYINELLYDSVTAEYGGGLADEIAITDGNITQEQIDFLFNSGKPTSEQQYPYQCERTISFNLTNGLKTLATSGTTTINSSLPISGPTFLYELKYNVTYSYISDSNFGSTSGIFITPSGTTKEISFGAKYINLSFTDANIPRKVAGYINDKAKGRGFNGSNYTANVSDWNYERVEIKFNDNGTGTDNYTQFYEFDNKQSESQTGVIDVLNSSNWMFYVKVMDYRNAPVEGAKIRAAFARKNGTQWKNFKLLGQRMTNGKGMTYFYIDHDTEAVVSISMDGYQTLNVTLDHKMYDYTETNPATFAHHPVKYPGYEVES